MSLRGIERYKEGTEPERGDCVFCEIVNGEKPAAKIFEDRRLVVILAREDGYPLILPKKHVVNLVDPKLDTATARDLGLMQRDMARIVARIDGTEGVSVITNNGEAAGQEIPHLHVHIMPRVEGDRKVRISFGTTLSLEALREKAVFYRQAIEDLQKI